MTLTNAVSTVCIMLAIGQYLPTTHDIHMLHVVLPLR